ncbi:MAG: Arm DNA-binding domain-containing protein, partial [Phycisphaerae bacterium]
MKPTDSVSVSPKTVTPKIAFTVASLAKIVCPPGEIRAYARDTKTPGLTFCRSASGKGVFALYKRVNGRPARIKLGDCPPMTIEQARRQAAILTTQIATGVDPQDAKRQARGESSLQDLFDDYLE